MKAIKITLALLVFVLVMGCYSCGSTKEFKFGPHTYQARPTVPDYEGWLGEPILMYQGENFHVVCWVAANPQNQDENIFILIGMEKKAVDDWTGYIIAVGHVPSLKAWQADKTAIFYYEDLRYIEEGVPSFVLSAVKGPSWDEHRAKRLIDRKEFKRPKI
jgi:hypothetical protein